MLHEHFQRMQRVCFDSEPSEQDLDALGSKDIWLIYRSMVRNRLIDIIHTALPRTRDSVGEKSFDAHVHKWLSKGGSLTRYFRHVPSEFAAFALEESFGSTEAWVDDLLRYEIAGWEVKQGPSTDEVPQEFSFKKRALMNPALRLLRLEYPVHEKPTPTDGYNAEATQLCIYRDSEFEALTWTLNPIAADLLDAWKSGDRTTTQVVQEVTTRRGVAIDETFLEKLSALLADFLQKGIILGSKAT